MPPPASFITISSVPFTQLVTQAMFNVANEQWFKYTATVPIVIGIQVNAGGNFAPNTRIYRSDGTTINGNTVGGTEGHWESLASAGDYYIRVYNFPTPTTNFDFTFTADTRPLDVISLVAGDIIVNDDTYESGEPRYYPAIVLSSTGVTKFFASSIPAGEFGAILPSNVSFWHDLYGQHSASNRIAVFDANLTYIGSPVCGVTTSAPAAFGTDVTNNKVYIVNSSRELWTISSTAVATNTGYTFPNTGAGSYPNIIAVNEDGTKLYWIDSADDFGIIHAFNLSTFTALPNLYTIPGFLSNDLIAVTPNSHAGDMFVMPNGNVVTWWRDRPTDAYKLIVLSSAGALLYTYEYPNPIALNHLSYIYNDSDHIMAWWYVTSEIARFGRITLATGVVDQNFEVPMFAGGQNISSIEKFGPSSSCTFVRIQTAAEPGGGTGGVFKIVPDKRTDHDGTNAVKIPNPTFKTGLMP